MQLKLWNSQLTVDRSSSGSVPLAALLKFIGSETISEIRHRKRKLFSILLSSFTLSVNDKELEAIYNSKINLSNYAQFNYVIFK